MLANRLARGLGWSGVLGCVAAAWLFLPRAADGTNARPGVVVALVDASASVVRTRAWLPWVRRELTGLAAEAAAAGEECAVLSYADGVATGFPRGSPAGLRVLLEGREGAPFDPARGLGRGATHLADALEAAEGLLATAERSPATVCLLAPPSFTGRSPAPSLARLAAAGVRLRVRPPPPAEESDLGLLELRLAPRVEAGAPLVALARLVWHAGASSERSATLELEVECDGSVRELERPLALSAPGELELPIDCGPAGFGRNEVRARCRLASGPDLYPENDRARATSLAAGARVVAVAVTPELLPAAEAWLEPAGRSALAGLQFLFCRPDSLAVELAGSAAVLTFDVPLGALPEADLGAFVRRGGGWLALSGYHFLDDWIPGAADDVLATLLPCEPAQDEAAARDVILVVDGSGSMEGAPFESVRTAALELVSAALPSDRVSLRFFTVRLEEEHVLKERTASRVEDREAARRAARELLALRVPSGSTYLLRSLRELVGALEKHEALVLLLSDGWERDALPDELALAERVREEFAAVRARLVPIAVGEPNLALLGALAGGEERVRSGRTLEDLRAVFHRELNGARIAEGELSVRLAARAGGTLADEVASAGSGPAALPPLERCVRNRLRPGGEALWVGSEGEPVLAIARADLGRTALFGSHPGPGWGSRYVRAGLGEPAEFESLLRWLARGPEAAHVPRARLEKGVLSVTGLPDGAPAVLRGRWEAAGAEGGFELVPPANLGRDVWHTREARVEALAAEVSCVELWTDPRSGAAPLTVPLERPPADEFAWREEAVELEPDADSERPAIQPELDLRSQPLAAGLLALSLVLLTAGGVAAGRGQGRRGFGR